MAAPATTATGPYKDGKPRPAAIGGLEMTTPVAPAASSTNSRKAHPPSASAGAAAAAAAPPNNGGRGGGGGGMVDMWAHNGLRGAAAVWIVIFHCYGLPKRSELQLNLQGAYVRLGLGLGLGVCACGGSERSIDRLIELRGSPGIHHHSSSTHIHTHTTGSTLMPMFFMLSGFALAATYGRKLWAAPRPLFVLPSSARCGARSSRPPPPGESSAAAAVEEGRGAAAVNDGEAEQQQQEQQPPAPLPRFPLQSFYQNRFARVMPVYYFCLLLCLPLWGLNVGALPFSRKTFVPSLLTSVFACTTLVSGAPLATAAS